MSVSVKSFRCRPMVTRATNVGAGVGKSPGKEPARDDQRVNRGRYGDFGVAGLLLDSDHKREAANAGVQ